MIKILKRFKKFLLLFLFKVFFSVSFCLVLNKRKEIENIDEELIPINETNLWNEERLTECLDGFVMILDSDSTILFITESVTVYLGLTQVSVFNLKKSFI